jgi:hypothetical protein
MLSDCPVPVSTKAITPAEPNSQNKPRECREQERYQVPFSEFRKNPTEGIKKDK